MFIGYYLKYTDSGNLKTVMGTVVHKVLEIIAKAKLAIDSGSKVVNDEILGGDFNIDMITWLKPNKLSSTKIETINKSRADKKIYVHDAKLTDGHIRRGEEFVEHVISLCYAYFSNKYSQFSWTKDTFITISNWVWMILEYKDGMYDPRYKKIVSTEREFDIEIKADWAKYNYDGVEGFFRIKGVIDLVVDNGDSYEVIDYKTGQRKNWTTGERKDYKQLQTDKQLLIYYYASRLLYPKVDDILQTIFFVRDGGAFTLCFDNSTIISVESYLRKRFLEIKNTKAPKLLNYKQKGFKCERFCKFSQVDMNGQNLCAAVHNHTKQFGIKDTIEKLKYVYPTKMQDPLLVTGESNKTEQTSGTAS